MDASNLLFLLVIFTFATKANPAEKTNEDIAKLNPTLPLFTWIDDVKIEVKFPDGSQDKIVLWPSKNIASMKVMCLYDGTMEVESSADIVVSGCKDDPLVSITIHSNRLIGRTMFNVRNNATEEIHNPYINDLLLNEDYEYEYDSIQRSKRSIFEDYIVEDYDEAASDGNVDPPPRLKLDIKLGFEESLKKHLGGESAAQEYVVKVFAHGRSYMRHNSLGTSLDLNLVEPPIFVANKTWKANRDSLTDAKTVKLNERIPHIFFCFDEDNDEYMGISRIRKGCDPTEGVGIVKYRKDVPLAANTFNHEKGHLVGLQHDREEDVKMDYGNQDDPCHGKGFMSEVSPSLRPAQFTHCNARRFKLWYNYLGKDCLQEVKIPEHFKTCLYPWPSDILPCICKVDNTFKVYLYCETLNQTLLDHLSSSFQCRNKIYQIEINMMGNELKAKFGSENIGHLEVEYVHIYNFSKMTVDFGANAFNGSSKTLKQIKIQKLPGNEVGEGTVRAESISNLVALEDVNLGENFELLESKSFSGLPLVVNLRLKGVKTIETDAFYDMAALKILDLSKNKIADLKSNFVRKAPKLVVINLAYNEISTLPSRAFDNLPSLAKIHLNNNKIASIQSNAFNNLPKIIFLDMGNNVQDIEENTIETDAFHDMAALKKLDLSNNKITDIKNNFVNKVPNLVSINLSNNSISAIPSKAFDNLPSLTKIHLNKNKIASIQNNAFNNLPKLTFLDMGENLIQDIGKSLDSLQNRDLIINLNETKIQLLSKGSFKAFIDNIVNDRGTGYIDLYSVVLKCGCDLKWLFHKQGISSLTKFHNAVCIEGHKLEEVDAEFIQHQCPFEDCPGIIPVIDGGWSSYTKCTKSCGGGTQERSCHNPTPAFGGKSCIGSISAPCNNQPCPLTLYIQKEEKIPTKGNLITTLPKLSKEYQISVDFKTTSVEGTQNIIHFTTFDKDEGTKPGGRNPAVWIASKKIWIAVDIGTGSTKGFYVSEDIVPTNQWINIDISQTLENGKYMLTVLVDGQQKYQVENSNPQEFSNVKVYAGDPWYDAVQGSIRNFFLKQS